MDILKESRKQLIKLIMTTITGNFGSSILSFIIGLLILKKTESALNFGISQIIGPLVALILVPFVGAIVDKYNKKIVIVIAQTFSIVSLLLYALSLNSNAETNLINTYLLLICLYNISNFSSFFTYKIRINPFCTFRSCYRVYNYFNCTFY